MFYCDIMSEEYSELWVTVKCRYTDEEKIKISSAWESLLSKYEVYDICDDENGEMFQADGIHFSIGAESSPSEKPNYKEQYKMFGEFLLAIQMTLAEWNLDIHIEKTGAS